MTEKDMINQSTLVECSSLLVTMLLPNLLSVLMDLFRSFLLISILQGVKIGCFILKLGEVAKLNDQFLHQQQESNANVDTLVQLLTPSMPYLFLTLALPLKPFTFSLFCCF
ncbi:hypothetical protein H5410_005280 [Solanum commersonii]|uniref:Uncharacterized protein n=1 Tax=Solanum commersonii TaxID=4109 RepID=A0A9J6A5Z2_SOLCO|nr:hypothetical protein H5410_005280 [Solanum commersonii]